jgi:hypothetical protein
MDIKKINEYEISCENKKEYSKIKEVKVLGKTYNLIVEYKSVKAPSLSIEKAKIMVVLPNKYKKLENDEIVKILIEKMYNMIAKKEIENIMEKYRILTGIAPEDYEINAQDRTLAKCINQKIIINPNIVEYNKETIEYIVLHEFCHLKYKNHTKSFYNMLKTYMPNYEKYASIVNFN